MSKNIQNLLNKLKDFIPCFRILFLISVTIAITAAIKRRFVFFIYFFSN
jgi:hypothetical protein